MSIASLNLMTDAVGWPSSVTVTQNYAYTSPDGKLTRSGTAVFHYARQRLEDIVAHPKMLCDAGSTPFPAEGKFLALQGALGKMPGWYVTFGPQPDKADAFTVIYTDEDGHVTTAHESASCNLSAVCAEAAPGRRVFPEPNGINTFAGFVAGIDPFGPYVTEAAYTIEQIHAAVAATEDKPGVGPVYRVTIPEEVGIIFADSMTIVRNGETVTTGASSGINDYCYVGWGALAQAVGGEARSPWVCEVPMPQVDDTLAAGKISYQKRRAGQSKLYVSPPGVDLPLAEPFALGVVSYPRDTDGLTVTVSFGG